jgi:hypothetical protein
VLSTDEAEFSRNAVVNFHTIIEQMNVVPAT